MKHTIDLVRQYGRATHAYFSNLSPAKPSQRREELLGKIESAMRAAILAEREACAVIADEAMRDHCSPRYVAELIRDRPAP